MDNNDILRRLRYTFSFNDRQVIAVFAKADRDVTRGQVSSWLKRDDDPAFVGLEDIQLATFLNGLIVHHRGKRDGLTPEVERQLSNNIVFRKLKIALNLKADDILSLLSRAEFRVSKPELSALFRKPGHKNYRECKDQILRHFLKGLQLEHRAEVPSDQEP